MVPVKGVFCLVVLCTLMNIGRGTDYGFIDDFDPGELADTEGLTLQDDGDVEFPLIKGVRHRESSSSLLKTSRREVSAQRTKKPARRTKERGISDFWSWREQLRDYQTGLPKKLGRAVQHIRQDYPNLSAHEIQHIAAEKLSNMKKASLVELILSMFKLPIINSDEVPAIAEKWTDSQKLRALHSIIRALVRWNWSSDDIWRIFESDLGKVLLGSLKDELYGVPLEEKLKSLQYGFTESRVNVHGLHSKVFSFRGNNMGTKGLREKIAAVSHFGELKPEDVFLWDSHSKKMMWSSDSLFGLCMRRTSPHSSPVEIARVLKDCSTYGVDLWLIRPEVSQVLLFAKSEAEKKGLSIMENEVCFKRIWREVDAYGKLWPWYDSKGSPGEGCHDSDVGDLRTILSTNKDDSSEISCHSDMECPNMETCLKQESEGLSKGKCYAQGSRLGMITAHLHYIDNENRPPEISRVLSLPYGASHEHVKTYVAGHLGVDKRTIGNLLILHNGDHPKMRKTFQKLEAMHFLARMSWKKFGKPLEIKLYVGSVANMILVDKIENILGFKVSRECRFLLEGSYAIFGEGFWYELLEENADKLHQSCDDSTVDALNEAFEAEEDRRSGDEAPDQCIASEDCKRFPIEGCWKAGPGLGYCLWQGYSRDRNGLGSFPNDREHDWHVNPQQKMIGSEIVWKMGGLSRMVPSAFSSWEDTAPVESFSTRLGSAHGGKISYSDESFTCAAFRVRDQGMCDSCGAMATSTTLGQRLCIMSKGRIDVQFSAGQIVKRIREEDQEGGHLEFGDIRIDLGDGFRVLSTQESPALPELCLPSRCTRMNDNNIKLFRNVIGNAARVAKTELEAGADIDERRRSLLERAAPRSGEDVEWQLRRTDGLMITKVSDSKIQQSCHDLSLIPTISTDETTPVVILAENDMSIWMKNPKAFFESIYQELLNNGPVTIFINHDLLEYTESRDGAIYTPHAFVSNANHAVTLVGWGTQLIGEEKIPYWLIQDSRGEGFNNGGFFKAYRGVDSQCWSSGSRDCPIDFLFAHSATIGGFVFIPQISKTSFAQATETFGKCVEKRIDERMKFIRSAKSDILGALPAHEVHYGVLDDNKLCKNDGVELAGCKECLCRHPWKGPRCDQCDIRCPRSTQKAEKECKCVCPAGKFGDTCKSYVRASTCMDSTGHVKFWMSDWRLEASFTERISHKIPIIIVDTDQPNKIAEVDEMTLNTDKQTDGEFELFGGKALEASSYYIYTVLAARPKNPLDPLVNRKIPVVQRFMGPCDGKRSAIWDYISGDEAVEVDSSAVPSIDGISDSEDIASDYRKYRRKVRIHDRRLRGRSDNRHYVNGEASAINQSSRVLWSLFESVIEPSLPLLTYTYFGPESDAYDQRMLMLAESPSWTSYDSVAALRREEAGRVVAASLEFSAIQIYRRISFFMRSNADFRALKRKMQLKKGNRQHIAEMMDEPGSDDDDGDVW